MEVGELGVGVGGTDGRSVLWRGCPLSLALRLQTKAVLIETFNVKSPQRVVRMGEGGKVGPDGKS